MTITGIIAEFNPFHNGHKYLLEQSSGTKIVVMSGNFMQRGEPALIDKWTRAQMALENGADLVVELPFLASVQSADYFAQAAVDILTRLGIDTLAFGTEEDLDYTQISQVYGEKEKQMTAFLSTLPDSLTYPQKTQAMWENFLGLNFSGQTPNHILGLAYAKACAGKGIELLPIKRLGAGFHSESKDEEIASATAIRKHILDRDFVEKVAPSSDLILSCPQVSWDDYFDLLKYQIVTSSDLTQFFQVNEELSSRIRSAIRSVATVEELVEKVATKRYTKARVRRILTYILVGAVEKPLPQAVHVLGFTAKGQAHLKSVKKSVDIVARIGAEPWDDLTQQADAVYQMGNSQILEQTWGRVPVRVEEV
ncbi:nucleotidyltransferase [Streptococcus loxodontisalivarius]|uniref:tRNA(Met) cytidine acetate ligase n=1 Tax=Streptococcus loxodontisalivarius TaxID=1349415 RepID=A0ABS2PPX4_9STRE|nr:nucleotidyltransferase [Streptococcus loxodontisalivarius]MBM7642088.1 putative nucleotidyltransferase [Streptococcus loxodontisalivarius]